jgi:hypothetical protein
MAPCPPFSLKAVWHGDRRGLIDGAIWLQDGCASIVLPQWPAAGLSSPALTRSSCEARKSHRRHPRCALAPVGAIACGLRSPGTFRQIGEGEYLAKSLRLASAPRGPHHPRDGPQERQRAEQSRLCLHNTSFRIIHFCGALQKVEVGACWRKRSNEGRDYLSIKLDDPSFKEPIYANLFDDEGGEPSSLV